MSFKNLWNDSVWSKIIATAILGVFGWLSNFLLNWWTNWQMRKIIENALASLYNFILSYYVPLIITVLVIIIAYQYYSNKKQTKTLTYKNKNDTGVDWLSNLDDQVFQRYFCLFWFPINHRLQTHNMFHDESLEHIPEVRELFDRKVLVAKFISVLEYVIEIDKDVYYYLEDICQRELMESSSGTERLVKHLQSTSFQMLFPKAKLY